MGEIVEQPSVQIPMATRRNTRRTQVKISVTPDLAAAFKNACIDSNVSMASVLSRFMAGYCQSAVVDKPSQNYSTRRHRRAVIGRIAKQLEMIKEAEERYMENIPENLRGSVRYEDADNTVSMIGEALDMLVSAY
jgi:hypothetical protein